MSPEDNDRIRVSTYTVVPTGYDQMVQADKNSWALFVVDGGSQYGWAIRRGSPATGSCMNTNGRFVPEPLPSGRSQEWLERHRWTLPEALQLALAHVDQLELNGHTAAQASRLIAGRLTDPATPHGQEHHR